MKKILALFFALLATPAAAQTIPSGAWGSINYWGVGGLSQVLAPGLAGQCLTSQNVGSAPIWVNCQVSSLSLLPSISANSIMANNTLNFVAPQAIDVNRVLDMVGYDIIRPPAVESIIYKSNVGPNFNWQTLPPGTTGSLLTSGGPTNPPFWAQSPAQGNLAAICATVGATLYFDTPSLLWKCLNPGTSGQLLQTGGAAGNPSWLTVTLATLGGVPSTRNVNTSAPLGGGGALSADLTLTCPTCATTTNGGALSATAPETISAAGVIACPTCATTTNGGALSATAPETISAAGVIACATCATTTNGGALSATAPVTLSAAGVIAMTNQGTTTTVLHGNAAGNPSFGAVAIGTDVSGLGTGVGTFLATPSSTNLRSAVGDGTGTGATVFATSPTITTPSIVGVADGSNAASGNVSQYIQQDRLSGAAITMTSGIANDITSFSFPAGRWLAWGNVVYAAQGTTAYNEIHSDLSLTTATNSASPGNASAVHVTFITGQTAIQPTAPQYYSFASPTTVFLEGNVTVTGGSAMLAYGSIFAIRLN